LFSRLALKLKTSLSAWPALFHDDAERRLLVV
jgi:hypothetical protein